MTTDLPRPAYPKQRRRAARIARDLGITPAPLTPRPAMVGEDAGTGETEVAR